MKNQKILVRNACAQRQRETNENLCYQQPFNSKLKTKQLPVVRGTPRSFGRLPLNGSSHPPSTPPNGPCRRGCVPCPSVPVVPSLPARPENPHPSGPKTVVPPRPPNGPSRRACFPCPSRPTRLPVPAEVLADHRFRRFAEYRAHEEEAPAAPSPVLRC